MGEPENTQLGNTEQQKADDNSIANKTHTETWNVKDLKVHTVSDEDIVELDGLTFKPIAGEYVVHSYPNGKVTVLRVK